MVEGAQKSGGALSGDGAGNHGSARGALATRYRFGFGSRVGRTAAKHRPRCCCVSTDASDIRMVYLGALRRHCTVPPFIDTAYLNRTLRVELTPPPRYGRAGR